MCSQILQDLVESPITHLPLFLLFKPSLQLTPASNFFGKGFQYSSVSPLILIDMKFSSSFFAREIASSTILSKSLTPETRWYPAYVNHPMIPSREFTISSSSSCLTFIFASLKPVCRKSRDSEWFSFLVLTSA